MREISKAAFFKIYTFKTWFSTICIQFSKIFLNFFAPQIIEEKVPNALFLQNFSLLMKLLESFRGEKMTGRTFCCRWTFGRRRERRRRPTAIEWCPPTATEKSLGSEEGFFPEWKLCEEKNQRKWHYMLFKK